MTQKNKKILHANGLKELIFQKVHATDTIYQFNTIENFTYFFQK